MNFKTFVLAAILGLLGVAVIAWLSHMSGPPGIDPEFVFTGEIERAFRTPEELIDTFKKDSRDADAKYNGKGIQVAGEAPFPPMSEEITEEDLNPLKLITADSTVVECYFPRKNRAELVMKVKMNPNVVIRGRCKGADKGETIVRLDGCTLVEGPKMPFMHP
jgi:hypothetical protein